MTSRWMTVGLAAMAAALLGLGTVASCGDDDSGTDAADTPTDDGAGRVENNPSDGVRADFVIDSLRIGNQDDGEGFNIDGINTPAGHAYLPQDGPGGVDNQLGSLLTALVDAGLDFDANADIAESITKGDLMIVLSHRDVDDWTNDPGWVPLFGYAAKDADDPEDPTNNLDGTGQLLIDPESLTDPTDEDTALISFPEGILNVTPAADGNLQRGDFEAGPSLFTVDLTVQDDSHLHLEMNGTRIVWDLETAPTGDPGLNGRIVNGLIGGYITLGDASRAIAQLDLAGSSIDINTIRSILAGQADMDVIPEGFTDDPCTTATVQTDCAPGQTCEADGGTYFCYEGENNPDAISVGLVFTAVSCEITGIYVDPTP
ncbi:MAG: hypothetical protein JXB32_12295 [Deltaproteobacteria bacterium]|nr:hypothetical protein [Deltaproteobacteria bacterium]